MPMPEKFVFIIGAAKCGTTSLASWLNDRSDMAFCAGKEPKFFTDFSTLDWKGPGIAGFLQTMRTTEAAYLAEFPADKNAIWGIDASTDYLWCEASPDLLQAWSRKVPSKLICILRDPVDRVLSEYQHTRRDQLETLSLAEALDREEQRIADHWHPLFYHRRRSLYDGVVTRYLELFGDDLLILDYEELKTPQTCLRKVEKFLGVSEQDTNSPAKQNASFVYRSPTAARLMRSTGVRSIARSLVPKAYRHAIYQKLMSVLKTKSRPSEAERTLVHDLLRDEIRDCAQNPKIPADHWQIR